MSRGTSKTKVINAVLEGISSATAAGGHYAIAEALVRNAQPCRVDIGLELDSQAKRAAISHEVRVIGLTGGVRATVIAAADSRAASLTGRLRELKASLRRRADGDPYRMLAVRLDDTSFDVERLHAAVVKELGLRAGKAEVFAGTPVELDGRSVTPAVVVVS